jgi:hypothetical protein
VIELLLPEVDDSRRAHNEKCALAASTAKAFRDAGNGQGLEACLAVLLTIATAPAGSRVAPRTRMAAAAHFAALTIKAADVGPTVAVQVNTGTPPGVPGDPRRTAEFWQGAMQDPVARAELLAGLSAAVGAPAPVNATTRATPAAAPPVNAGPKKRRTSSEAPRKAGAA